MQEVCVHGLDPEPCGHCRPKHTRRVSKDALVRVSPTNQAHLDGCTHKVEGVDRGWGEIHEEGAWATLLEQFPWNDDGKTISDMVTTSGDAVGSPVKSVCRDCREYGPF